MVNPQSRSVVVVAPLTLHSDHCYAQCVSRNPLAIDRLVVKIGAVVHHTARNFESILPSCLRRGPKAWLATTLGPVHLCVLRFNDIVSLCPCPTRCCRRRHRASYRIGELRFSMISTILLYLRGLRACGMRRVRTQGPIPLFGAALIYLLTSLSPLVVQAQNTADEPIRVATYLQAPWVVEEDGAIIGFHAELWQAIANRLERPFEYVFPQEWKQMREMVKDGDVDIAVQHHAATAEREQVMDFTHPVFADGMLVLTRKGPNKVIAAIKQVLSASLLKFIVGALFVLLAVAHGMWWIERNAENSDFRKPYLAGIWDGFYWTVVTITTVGYGDQSPKRDVGKLFALVWMVAGLFLLSVFVAQVTATFTVNNIQSFNEELNLSDKTVGTFDSSKLRAYLEERGYNTRPAKSPQQLLRMLTTGDVDALLLDLGTAQYMAKEHAEQIEVSSRTLNPGHISYPVKSGSSLREEVNRALLSIRESGEYQKIYAKWFGD